MPTRVSTTGSELFIVDNSDKDWKVARYLHDWCQISAGLDIATAYFEIGALLALNSEWQKIDKIRILMGDEVSKRTKAAFVEGLHCITRRLNQSIEDEKQKNDFLAGVPEIVEAIRSGQIECRVYRKDKFHAKTYITHARLEVVGSAALVGSSNFTKPGLTENVELNVKIDGPSVSVLQEWYEEHWKKAEDVTEKVLRVIERHIREYSPFEVYVKALQELFRHQRDEPDYWETHKSSLYPLLDQYQRDGYNNLLDIAEVYNGAFLCDGVGLGKTFIGMMLIERLIMHESKNVLLLVPKAGLEAVWKPALKRYLPKLRRGAFGGLEILTHTDLSRIDEDTRERFEAAKERAHVIIIDEAHHFRNPGTKGEFTIDALDGPQRGGRLIRGEGKVRPSRYWKLFDITGSKKLFLLTATPLNNSLNDLRHMIELFSRRQDDYFATKPIGVHNLRSYFAQLNKRLEEVAQASGQGSIEVETNPEQALEVLADDTVFKALVVQRSRGYVKEHQEIHGGRKVVFPTRDDPQVATYELRATYGKLLDMLAQAFDRKNPLFSLAPYNPTQYAFQQPEKGDFEAQFIKGRQAQVVGLVRTGFLKRFESSVEAFRSSCSRLLVKLLAFVVKHAESPSEKKALNSWMGRHKILVEELQEKHPELFYTGEEVTLFDESELEDDEDVLLAQSVLDNVAMLSRDDYRVPDMIMETLEDLQLLGDFLDELRKFKSSQDYKLKKLLELLKKDAVLKKHKVMIFTEFADTAEYLRNELLDAGIDGLEAVDGSALGRARVDVIKRFAPFYNSRDDEEVQRNSRNPIRVLISTDVLSEGLNLQDATRLINYDLHWNPVRLMQRIGRIDRRLNPDIERDIIAANPDQKDIRGHIIYWNFLPPDELNTLLTLYSKVTHKTLRISKTFGIEGRKLLTPEDDYESLREFNAAYERQTRMEELSLEYDRLLMDHPDLGQQLHRFPLRVFSGKERPSDTARAVFFCFTLPVRIEGEVAGTEETPLDEQLDLFGTAGGDAIPAKRAPSERWSVESGLPQWYLYDIESKSIQQHDAPAIADLIRSTPETPRRCVVERPTLSTIRTDIEKYIKNTYLKQVQAPLGVRPVLRCWMELN